MDGLGGHYAKWNKSERQILYDITDMWYLKNLQTSEYNKKEADSDIETKVVVTSGEKEWKGQYRGPGWRDTDCYVQHKLRHGEHSH